MIMMSEQRFEVFQECEYLEEWSSCPYCIKYDGETVFETLPLGIAKEVCKKLNEQQSIIRKDEISIKTMMSNMKKLEEEKVELMEDCACQYRQIQKLESENDDLRTTITKQVEAITEMKDIIYMLQDLRIGDYSSEIEKDMQELKKAYDGTLEDFLNYCKD